MRRLVWSPTRWLQAVSRRAEQLRREEDSDVLVIIGAGVIVMQAMCALTIDLGRYFEMRRQLRNAATAVHAGRQVLPETAAAETEAERYFDLNAPTLGSRSISFSRGGLHNERVQILV